MASIDPANGERIRAIRHQLGWTQEMLAKQAGLCVRVVAKAESSRPVSSTTISRIARALRNAGPHVTATDLLCNPISVVSQVIDAYVVDPAGLVGKVRHLLSSAITVWIDGNPAWLRVAGEHRGVNTFDRLCKSIFGSAKRHEGTLGQIAQIVADHNRVIAWGYEVFEVGNTRTAPLFVMVRCEVYAGLATRLWMHFDSLGLGTRLIKVLATHSPASWAELVHVDVVRADTHIKF